MRTVNFSHGSNKSCFATLPENLLKKLFLDRFFPKNLKFQHLAQIMLIQRFQGSKLCHLESWERERTRQGQTFCQLEVGNWTFCVHSVAVSQYRLKHLLLFVRPGPCIPKSNIGNLSRYLDKDEILFLGLKILSVLSMLYPRIKSRWPLKILSFVTPLSS